MTPYAAGRRWTLYGGDCLAALADGLIPADAAIIADPPYGMGWNPDSTRFTGGDGRASGRVKMQISGDDAPFDPSPWLDFPAVCLFGANHYAARLPVGTTLVWIKRPDRLFGAFLSDAEIAWVKGGYGVYAYRQMWLGVARHGEENGEHDHPTQKPVALMAWCMDRAKVPADALVVDPYTGSGTTGVAALRSGRRFLGFEIEPSYLAIAARRLAQAEDDGVPLALPFTAPVGDSP